jgi:hypothetical protein
MLNRLKILRKEITYKTNITLSWNYANKKHLSEKQIGNTPFLRVQLLLLPGNVCSYTYIDICVILTPHTYPHVNSYVLAILLRVFLSHYSTALLQ